MGLIASILLFGVELFSILDAVDAFRALNKMGTLSNDLIDIPELRRLLQSNPEYVDAHLCLKKAGYVRPEMYSPDNYRVLNETLEYAKNKGFTNDSIIEILQHNRDRGHQNLTEFLERLKRKMADAGDAQKNLKLLREALPSDHPIQWSIFDNTTKPMQDHHWIHQSMVKHHPLAKRAQELDVDIVTAEWNIDRIPHQGGHTDKAVEDCRRQLDIVQEKLEEKLGDDMDLWIKNEETQEAITNVLTDTVKTIKDNIRTGKIQLYNEI